MEAKTSCIKTYDMDSGIETAFKTFIKQGELAEAVDFISLMDQECIPSSSIIRSIIFDILIRCKDVSVLSEAKAYLLNLLEVYPPFDEERRKYYQDGICDSKGVLSELWSMFSHIVRSCLHHYGIIAKVENDEGPELINYPNCSFLLDLYVKIFIKDFEHFSSERRIYAYLKKVLLTNLLWPNSSIGDTKNNSIFLMKWLNDIYRAPDPEDKGNVLDSLHELLALMIKYIIEKNRSLLEIEALNSTYLVDIVDNIMNSCKDAFSNLSNFNMFVTCMPLKYVQARISEKVILKFCSRSKPHDMLTLKKIVVDYMFSGGSKKKRPKDSCVKGSVPRSTSRQKLMLKRTIPKSTKGNTELHELCKKNKFGDLAACLKSEQNVNMQNNVGHTPLHEACINKSHYCIKVLIAESGKDGIAPVDLMAVSKEGYTPLHYAVMMDDVAIAKTLLINGGAQLLKLFDHKGHKPSDFAASSDMEKFLNEFEQNCISDASHAVVKDEVILEAHALRYYKDYSLYLQALNYLLCSYCDIFQIYKYIWKGTPEPACHDMEECYHFIKSEDSVSEITACSEDVKMIKDMKTYINMFIASVSKRAKELDLELRMELIPLKAFAASVTKESSDSANNE